MKKTAFSLVELVVVIFVISVITLGIMKGGAVIKNSRLSAARSLTSGSAINEIDGILAWYETSLPESLKPSETVENSSMTAWYDVSSQLSISDRKNALTRSADSNVAYRTNGINDLPSLQFAASGRFSLSEFYQGTSSRYSVFAVLSPTLAVSGTAMVFIDSHSSGSSNSISIDSNSVDISSGSSLSLASSFSQLGQYVLGVYINNAASNIYVNDVDVTATSAGISVNGFQGLTVGANKSGGSNFTGLISEVIIFNRILSEKERLMIMSYLAKKYNIRVEGAFF